jgi:hypothetical protein
MRLVTKYVCENDDAPKTIQAQLRLNRIEYFADVSVVIEPANEPSR